MEDGRNGSDGKVLLKEVKSHKNEIKRESKDMHSSDNCSNVNVSYNNSDTLGEIHKCKFKNLRVKFSP